MACAAMIVQSGALSTAAPPGPLFLQVRTTIEAKLMRPNLLVEVDCIAAAQQA